MPSLRRVAPPKVPSWSASRKERSDASLPTTTERDQQGVETPGTGGRRHACLSLEQEQTLLPSFAACAERGEMSTARDIQQAVEARVIHHVGISSVYRLLPRHGWRKLVPRPRHPKANEGEQAAWVRAFPTLVQTAVATRDPTDQRPVLKMAEYAGSLATHLCGTSRIRREPEQRLKGRFLPQFLYACEDAVANTSVLMYYIQV
jgi:transposase